MPEKDGTGPAGKGAKSGGQSGNCAGAKPTRKPKDGSGQGKGKARKRQNNEGRKQGKGRVIFVISPRFFYLGLQSF